MSYLFAGNTDPDDGFGVEVEWLTDFNGDGIADLLVSAFSSNIGAENAGTTWLVSGAALAELDAADGLIDGTIGAASFGASPDVYALVSTSPTELAGISVSALADMDGDGLTDILIGAEDASAVGAQGTAYVITAASLAAADAADGTVDTQIDLALAIQQPGNFAIAGPTTTGADFGSPMTVGDVNGDGVTDMMIADLAGLDDTLVLINGAQLAALDALSAGSPSVVEADDIGSLPGTFVFTSPDFEPLGLDIGGDFDGDGSLDLLIGLTDTPIPFNAAGSVHLVTIDALGIADAADGTDDGVIDIENTIFIESSYVFYGNQAIGQIGSSVAALDFTGDGAPDIAIGAATAGQVFLMPGDAASLQTFDAQDGLIDGKIYLGLTQGIAGSYVLNGLDLGSDNTGALVRNVGDVDGDGSDDFLIGATTTDYDGADGRGGVYLVTSGSLALADELDGFADGSILMGLLPSLPGNYLFVGAEAGDLIGRDATMAGDVDGDGLADLLIGTTHAGDDEGAAYLLLAAEFDALDAADGTLDGIIDLAYATLGDRSGTSGDDTLIGSEGDDSLDSRDGNDLVIGGGGDDLIDGGSEGNNTLEGGDGNDTIYAGGWADSILGGDGDDEIFAGFGDDTVLGGDGDDEVRGDWGNDSLFGEDGHDTIYAEQGDDTAFGGDGNDKIYGDEGQDSLSGEDGDDSIYAGDENDTVDGGADADALYGFYGDDSLSGNTGNDSLFGEYGNDTLLGGAGFDTLYGGDDNDSLLGEGQADRIYGGAGNDTGFGGDGTDNLYGDAGNDSLFGDGSNDRIFGGDDNDYIRGGLQEDALLGEDGNDSLFGDGGFDLMLGGTGDDYLDGGNQADNLYGDAGNDTLYGGEGFDRLFGGFDQDILYGGNDGDALFGDGGDDTLYGEDGADRFFAGAGNDIVYGGADNDEIGGGGGFDRIDGGAGDDRLYGNFNADVFVFADGHGMDTIFDFEATNAFEDIDVSAVTSFGAGVVDYTTLLASGAVSSTGGGVLIDTGGGNSIFLSGVNIADLDNSDFIF